MTDAFLSGTTTVEGHGGLAIEAYAAHPPHRRAPAASSRSTTCQASTSRRKKSSGGSPPGGMPPWPPSLTYPDAA